MIREDFLDKRTLKLAHKGRKGLDKWMAGSGRKSVPGRGSEQRSETEVSWPSSLGTGTAPLGCVCLNK